MDRAYRVNAVIGGVDSALEIVNEGLFNARAVAVGHFIFVHFGTSFLINRNYSTWVLNTVTMVWSRSIPECPPALRDNPSIALRDDHAYMIGGWDHYEETALDSVLKFDYVVRDFVSVQTTGLKIPPTVGHRSIYSRSRDEILLFGVGQAEADPANRELLAITAQEVVYKPAARGAKPPLFPYCSVAETLNAVFLFGGKLFKEDIHVTNQLFVLHLDKTLYWSYPKLHSDYIPPPRRSCEAVVLNNEMIVYGGRDDNIFFSDLNAFDLKSQRWHRIGYQHDGQLSSDSYVAKCELIERSGLCFEVCGEKAFIIGGGSIGALDAMDNSFATYHTIEDLRNDNLPV